jgi:hypothetical protein
VELPRSPGPAAERASARWVAGVLGATLAVLGAAAAFVVWVDPFQQYHLATRYPPRFYFLHHRYIDPGLAKNQTYDTVVSGSSIMENTRNDFVAKACGGSAVNLSMPAMSASEQRLMLETAFADRPVRRVIAVLDFNEFSGGMDERQDVAGPLPRYLYDRNPFNDLPYLLSRDVLVKAWRIVGGIQVKSSHPIRTRRGSGVTSSASEATKCCGDSTSRILTSGMGSRSAQSRACVLV